MPLRMVLLICAFSGGLTALADDVWMRVNRPFREMEGCRQFEVAFLTKVTGDPWFPIKIEFASSDSIVREILAAENWKFAEFYRRKFFDPQKDAKLIQRIRQIEALLRHDDIILIYEWEPYTRERNLVAMGAIKRHTLDPNSRLLLEEANHFRIETPPILDIPVSDEIPHHWYPGIAEVSHAKRYFGDVLHINSLVVEHQRGGGVAGRRFLSYLYGFAYWHGLLTTGRVIPKGQSVMINGRLIEGPAVLVPTHFVGEGYERRADVYQKLNFVRHPVSGKLIFPSQFQPDRNLSMMLADWNGFRVRLPQTLGNRVLLGAESVTTFMGPLAVVPMLRTGAQMEGTFFLDPPVEKKMRSCSWAIAVSESADRELPGLIPLHADFNLSF